MAGEKGRDVIATMNRPDPTHALGLNEKGLTAVSKQDNAGCFQ
jgi:hypothetical protein